MHYKAGPTIDVLYLYKFQKSPKKRAQQKNSPGFAQSQLEISPYFKLIENCDRFQSAFSIFGFTKQIRKLKKKVNEKDI